MVSHLLRKVRSQVHARLPWLSQPSPAILEMGYLVVLTSVTVSALLLGMRYLGLFQGMELSAYDQLIRLRPALDQDDRLLIVGITEEDIQSRQEWPISDQTIAQLLKNLEQHQPSVIGLDVIRDVPIEPGRAELLSRLQGSDRIITVCKASTTDNPGIPPPPKVSPDSVGFADLVVDPGGILRRSLLLLVPPAARTSVPSTSHLCNDSTVTLPAFSLQMALRYLQQKGVTAEVNQAGELRIGSTLLRRLDHRMGGYQNADTSGYQIMLNYRSGKQVARVVSLTDVLNNRVNPEWVRNRIVLIGYTTPAAKDDFYTPYSVGEEDGQKMYGVVVHAQSVSQILAAVLDHRPLLWAWSGMGEGLWIVGWSVVGGVLALQLRHPLRFGLVLMIAAGSVCVISFLVFLQGGWIPCVPGAIALVTTSIGVILVDRFNKSTYGQMVQRQVKSFLKIEIDIDQEKLEKQVADITETDYFQDLQQKARLLRGQQRVAMHKDSKSADEDS